MQICMAWLLFGAICAVPTGVMIQNWLTDHFQVEIANQFQ
jgi:hypothetical protein